jgi:undecaprenyl-diphosphatase
MDSIIIFCAKYLFVAVILIVAASWLQAERRTRLKLTAAIVLAGILALIISRIAGRLYYDPRPFVSSPNLKPLITHAPDNGFPSDHALLTMTLTAVLYFYNRGWAAAAFAVTVIVGIARVLAHIHSPIDIIGAWLIAMAAATAAFYAVGYLTSGSKLAVKPIKNQRSETKD